MYTVEITNPQHTLEKVRHSYLRLQVGVLIRFSKAHWTDKLWKLIPYTHVHIYYTSTTITHHIRNHLHSELIDYNFVHICMNVWMLVICCLMKQNCYFQRNVAECRHVATPLSSYSINTTHQGFQKRYLTMLYLKRLKRYQQKCKWKVRFTK